MSAHDPADRDGFFRFGSAEYHTCRHQEDRPGLPVETSSPGQRDSYQLTTRERRLTVRVGTGYAELALGSADYSLRAEPGVHTLVAVDEAPSLDDPPTVSGPSGSHARLRKAGTTIRTIDYSMGAQAAGPFKLSIASDFGYRWSNRRRCPPTRRLATATFFEPVALLGQYCGAPSSSERTKDDDYAMQPLQRQPASLLCG